MRQLGNFLKRQRATSAPYMSPEASPATMTKRGELTGYVFSIRQTEGWDRGLRGNPARSRPDFRPFRPPGSCIHRTERSGIRIFRPLKRPLDSSKNCLKDPSAYA